MKLIYDIFKNSIFIFATLGLLACGGTSISTKGEQNVGIAPTLTITSPSPNLTNGTTIPLTFTFSEEIIDFKIEDISSTIGDIGNFSGSDGDTVYTADLVLTNDGIATVSVLKGAGIDNTMKKYQTEAGQISITRDTSQPSVILSAQVAQGGTRGNKTTSFTATFSEAITGFDASDISVTNGEVSNISGSGKVFTFTVTTSENGTVTTKINASAVTDLAGNNSSASDTYSFTHDDSRVSMDFTSPSGTITSTSPVMLTINFPTPLEEGSLSIDDFSIINGSVQNLTGSGSTYTLEITPTTSGIVTLSIAQGAALTSTGQENDAASYSFTYDNVVPTKPSVTIATESINNDSKTLFGFSVTDGESNNSYSYSISDGTNQVTGSGSLNGSGEISFSGIDVSSLSDGILTLSIIQTDPAGNSSTAGTATVHKDTVAPVAPIVSITSNKPIKSGEEKSFAITLSNGTIGNTYSYTITSTGGGTPITGNGTFDASGTFSTGSLDISNLQDGTINVNVTSTDIYNNTSIISNDNAIMDTVVSILNIDTLNIDAGNESNYSFTLTGEPGAVFNYEIKSSNGGTPLTGTGTFGETGEYDVGPLNLSDLNDGWVILKVDITDIAGNLSQAVSVVEKNSTPALTTAVNFGPSGSNEPSGVTFDMTNNGSQSVPSGYVKYDTTQFTGSTHDDVIQFSTLADGEVYTVDGGNGFNTIDLSSYTGDNITIECNDKMTPKLATNRSGTITVDLGDGKSSTINFTNCERFVFNSKIFNGTTHGLVFVYPDNGGAYFKYYNGTYLEIRAQPENSTLYGADDQPKYAFANILYKGSMDKNYDAVVIFKSINYQGTNKYEGISGWHNAALYFDYISLSDNKYLRLQFGQKRWILGGTGLEDNLKDDDTVQEDVAMRTVLKVRGTGENDGKTAQIYKGDPGSEVFVMERTYGDLLNNGIFSVSNKSSQSIYSLKLQPSNWAPFVKNFDTRLSQTSGAAVTLDLVGNSFDNDGTALTLTSISAGSTGHGTMTNNGDGTVTYQMSTNAEDLGSESFTYTISDGVNSTTGSIRFEVVP